MKSLEESILESMDGSDPHLFSFLPYMLQDLWEIGTDPSIVISLIKDQFDNYNTLKVLDLGCGKGAVSIQIAKNLGCRCHGIDGMENFINKAREIAGREHVSDLCYFEVDDIRAMDLTSTYDVIVLGAIGPVLGDHYHTLTKLAPLLNPNGGVILDEAYIADDKDPEDGVYCRAEILDSIERAGMIIKKEHIISPEHIAQVDQFMYSMISQRCSELMKKYPDKEQLFYNYLKAQREENKILENHLTCSTMLITHRI